MALRGKSEGHGFAHSMTDLMAGVAVTFLLIAAIFMVRAAESAKADAAKLKRIEDTDETARRLLQRLSEDLQADAGSEGAFKVAYNKQDDPFLLTVTLDRRRVMFADGECDLNTGEREPLRRSLRLVFERVCAVAGSGLLQSISLEGHTDERPFHPKDDVCGIKVTGEGRRCKHPPASESEACVRIGFENNVRLSGARAQNVFFEMLSALRNDEKLRPCLEKNFIVAGRGPVEPLDGRPWDTPRDDDERKENRRVVIKVRAIARPLAEVLAQ